ncbi:hypothetical protein ANCCAN_17463 [Ancylostoma caninum]|uniref:Uncharacterized protein n=1 Tax=Ancylostoma caninum TaxID=29170 RepID=A0A368G0Z2_ANCCA|nr:hypothetical protein ANCCAN_17463 [Ancylostoma caninum]
MSVCLLEGHNGQHIAILNEDWEKLRPTDGRIIRTADEMSCQRRSTLFGHAGVVDRYNFNFEFSRLQLPSSKMQLVQYLPHMSTTDHKDGATECPRRHGFELTSAEFSEFCERLASLPVVERGTFTRNRGLALLGQSYDVINAQPYSENWGDVPNSTLSSRLNEYNKGMDVIKRRKKALFSYTDELVDKKKIEFYESVIDQLDKLLDDRVRIEVRLNSICTTDTFEAVLVD